MNVINDIYYNKSYVSLYLKDEEEMFEFNYQEGDFQLYNLAIKRPIKTIGHINIDEEYYDLETAYGYGGIICNTDNEEFIKKGLTAYEKKCREQNIIAEFTRFHPFNTFHKNNNSFFNFLFNDRKTVYIDTTKNKEKRWEHYASRTRSKIRKCERELRIERSDDYTSFIKLYTETMDKNNADDFFYFNQKFYKDIKDINEIELYNVFADDELLSSSLYIFTESFVHYFLSGNNYNVKKNHNANYFIFEKIAQIAKERGIKYFNLGGGRSGDIDDSLFKYKSLFSNFTRPFYLSGKIFNQKKYNEYIKLWEKLNPEKKIQYFLKYRL